MFKYRLYTDTMARRARRHKRGTYQMKLMLGNEAVARGAWEAGVNVSTAYPGTPSTEITENMAKYGDVFVEWAANEKVALEVALGAAMGGARALCCMKHVGVNVAADPLFTAAYSGVGGGLVLVCADDPGMHSSQNEQDSRFYAMAAHVPMLEPANSAECLEYTKRAFALSEHYDTPVMLRLVTRIAHARSLVEEGERQNVPVKDYVKNPAKYVMMPGFARGRHVVVEQREKDLAAAMTALGFDVAEYGSLEDGVICSGSAYNYVKEALPHASVLKLGMVYPLNEPLIREFAAKVKNLYVVEELEPIFETAIKAMGLDVTGKEVTGRQGELFATTLKEKILGAPNAGPMETADIPPRPPVLCPGCPHRAVFHVLGKLKMNVIGDIGCYTLGALAPLSAMDSEICMGAAVGMAEGFLHARGKEAAAKTVAVLGDSTFVHSGITGLVNAVYNRAASTVMILDNSTTGMTGHQPNPATGVTIRGEMSTRLNLEKLCAAIGVQHVRVVDPFDMKALEAVVKEECARNDVSVIIARRPCALLSKTHPAAYTVAREACVKCKACMRIGCPAISMAEDGAHIDAAQCVGCGVCAGLCPSGAIQAGKEAK